MLERRKDFTGEMHRSRPFFQIGIAGTTTNQLVLAPFCIRGAGHLPNTHTFCNSTLLWRNLPSVDVWQQKRPIFGRMERRWG